MKKSKAIEEYIKTVTPMLPPMDKEQTEAFRQSVDDAISYIPDDLFNKFHTIYPMLGNDKTCKIPIIIKEPMHLRFDLRTAYESGEKEHAQTVMAGLGITYQHATPQSMGDQWWFWNCENTPNELPEYLTKLDLDPMECIGYGLSQENAYKISNYPDPEIIGS